MPAVNGRFRRRGVSRPSHSRHAFRPGRASCSVENSAGNTETAKTVAEATTTVGSAVTCATDAAAQVTINQGGYRFNNATQRFVQSVTITRLAAGPLAGPFAFALKRLSFHAALYNPAGTTACIAPGSHTSLWTRADSGAQARHLRSYWSSPIPAVRVSRTRRYCWREAHNKGEP